MNIIIIIGHEFDDFITPDFCSFYKYYPKISIDK